MRQGSGGTERPSIATADKKQQRKKCTEYFESYFSFYHIKSGIIFIIKFSRFGFSHFSILFLVLL